MTRDPMTRYGDTPSPELSDAMLNLKAIDGAVHDARIYGNGWLRVDADGNIHRMDPTRILVEYKLD